MISQADIIRTLVNRNCTDESIMSMALSPDCTPPRLMEKFTEAERFDLALDVSMKLGLDVLPLWKTWAIRCLRNRNFQGAREKFRHCFLRLKSPGGRQSPAASGLLSDILNILTRMEETKVSLSDEIDCIKQRKSPFDINQRLQSDNFNSKDDLISSRSTIYAECSHYLKEYANPEDKIRFYIRNFLWDEATKVLFDNRIQINADKFFITEILMYLTSTGHLDKFLSAFIKTDPDIKLSLNYFKAVYNFCTTHRRYNLLYYIQATIGDYVAAARNQINHCFLKKPMLTYKELNYRLSSLTNASKNYQDYILKLEQQTNDSSPATTTPITPSTTGIVSSNKLEQQQQQQGTTNNSCSLFSELPLDEVQKQLKTIELQIDITRNFAINEVSGCINGIEVVVGGHDSSKSGSFGASCDNSKHVDDDEPIDSFIKDQKQTDDSPVTLFDKSERRKTFLAALVLIYFDLTCSTNFSKNGLDLANKLIDTYRLDKLRVFKMAMRIIIEDESCDILENAKLLLDRLREDLVANYVRSPKRNPPRQQQQQQLHSHQKSVNKKASSASLVSTSPSSFSSISSFSSSSIGSSSSASHAGSNVSSNYYNNIIRQLAHKQQTSSLLGKRQLQSSPNKNDITTSGTSTSIGANEAARMICDEVIRDSIGSCREADYKMELAKLLSGEARIELYIGLAKLSNAQRLAFNMNRPDYVSIIIEEAARLNQNHMKTVCQLWLAKRT